MSDPVTVNTLGRLAEKIRAIFGRLDPLETQAKDHDKGIRLLQERADRAQKELDDLRKVTDHQGRELEQHRKQIAHLTTSVADLEGDIEKKSTEIKSLHSVVRGEQIKRGKAAARATRAEEALGRKRK